jgi:hypothetical protein
MGYPKFIRFARNGGEGFAAFRGTSSTDVLLYRSAAPNDPVPSPMTESNPNH